MNHYIFQDLECYPELEYYVLENLIDGSESFVTLDQINEAFHESDVQKMLSGRHSAWLLYKRSQNG